MPETRLVTKRTNAARGFTLVEVTISIFVMTMAFGAFLGVALQSVQDFEVFNANQAVAQWNQESVNEIRDDTLSVRQYFDNFAVDGISQDYFNALQLPVDSMPINGSVVLPVITENGDFEPDVAGSEKTGNALFFVRALTPFTMRIQMDPSEPDPANWHIYRNTVYEFVLYYLTRRVSERCGNSADSLDLIRWGSVAILDYNQAMEFDLEIDDGTNKCYPRAQLVTEFINQYGSDLLWVSGSDLDNAFYKCYADGTIDAVPIAAASVSIPMAGYQGVFSYQAGGGVNHVKQASVCMNRGLPGFETGPIIPRYAIPNLLGDGFPHGFEIQIIGPSGAREMLLRLAMGKSTTRGLYSKDFTAILTTRDF